MKQYRSKEERVKNSLGKKRGGCVEILRNVKDFTEADSGLANSHQAIPVGVLMNMTIGDFMDQTGSKELYAIVAGVEECMRDEEDVQSVMTEKNIVGNVIYVRRMGSLSRVIRKVFSFVKAKNDVEERGEEN
jgi:hypothetical protein